ncbi:MAG: efflux RND transporter periplasmic adaptor subunit [Isosphaeraceae bacterium]
MRMEETTVLRNLASLTFAVALIAGISWANLQRRTSVILSDWRIVPDPVVEVQVETPTRGSLNRTIIAKGIVEPIEEAKVGSQMSGRVVAVNVREGDHVAAGDLLVKLDDSDPKARLLSTHSRINRLRAAITQAEVELARANREQVQQGRLANRGVASPKELADARSIVATAEAALEACRHEMTENQSLLRIAEEELRRTEIRAPISGTVTRLDVAIGEVVIAGTANLPGTVLMTISNLAEMRIKAEVDESDIPLVRPGQTGRVFLQANNRAAIRAVVDKVSAKGRKIDGAVSFETRLKVEDRKAPLRAEMTATVEIDVKHVEDALGLPIQAVVQRRRRDLPDIPEFRAFESSNPTTESGDLGAGYLKIVFVLEGGIARARPVATGISTNRRVEIISGLSEEDLVILGPFRVLDELKDGLAVKPTPAPTDRLGSGTSTVSLGGDRRP